MPSVFAASVPTGAATGKWRKPPRGLARGSSSIEAPPQGVSHLSFFDIITSIPIAATAEGRDISGRAQCRPAIRTEREPDRPRVGNLTGAAYANQRMTLYPEIAKFQIVKRNTMVALRW